MFTFSPMIFCHRRKCDFLVRCRYGLLKTSYFPCFAHLVVGPDVEKAWREKNTEDHPYAREAFGGVLLSENAEFDGMSSKLDEWRNTPERWRMMFSVEPTLIRCIDHDEDTRGFHTKEEVSPWVQFKSDGRRKITGMQVEIFREPDRVCPLKVWTSEDGRNFREVYEDMVVRPRYMIDLRGIYGVWYAKTSLAERS